VCYCIITTNNQEAQPGSVVNSHRVSFGVTLFNCVITIYSVPLLSCSGFSGSRSEVNWNPAERSLVLAAGLRDTLHSGRCILRLELASSGTSRHDSCPSMQFTSSSSVVLLQCCHLLDPDRYCSIFLMNLYCLFLLHPTLLLTLTSQRETLYLVYCSTFI